MRPRQVADTHTGLRRTGTCVALGIIASAQWSFTRALKNDAFVDEATYIVAGRMLHSVGSNADAAPAFATYFSGAPHLYPVLAAYVDARAGLEGARGLSFVCMVIAMLAVYVAARHLFRDRLSGVLAAAVFAMQAPVLFLMRLATFDAPCVALLAVALAACAVASTRKRATSALCAIAVAGGCVGAAAAIKYATLLYVPCVIVLATLLVPRWRWFSLGVATVSAAAVAALCVAPADPQALLQGFLATTVTRVTVSGDQTIDILAFAAHLGGFVGLMALPVWFLRHAVSRAVLVTLITFALAAPFNHARLNEMVSLHKHVAFSLVLLAPLAGGAIARGLRWVREEFDHGSGATVLTLASVALVIIIRLNAMPAAAQARTLYTYWPNNTRLAYLAVRPIANADARILSEEPDLGWFYTGAAMPYANWSHPYYFGYKGATTTAASDSLPRQALRDSYFDAVVLRYGPRKAWARAIEQELLGLQPAYRLATRLPFTLADGPGAYEVWVRADAPGADAVR